MPTKVRIGPNESPTVEVLSDRELIATYMGGWDGPCDVVVETSKGSAVAENAFTATPRPLVTIDEVTPDHGHGGTRVRITGSGFEE